MVEENGEEEEEVASVLVVVEERDLPRFLRGVEQLGFENPPALFAADNCRAFTPHHHHPHTVRRPLRC